MAADPETSEKPAVKPRRIEALDAARGLALIAMATYHFTWDFEFFGYLDPGTATHGWLKLYARVIASSFLFLAGFSLVLAQYPVLKPRSFAKRLAVIVAAALAITLATAIAMPDGLIFFGILHAIAAASLIGLAFLRLPPVLTLLAAAGAIALPDSYRSEIFDAPALLFVGLSEHLPRSNDYVPLFPWIGALLIGIATARIAMARGWLVRLAHVPAGPGWLRLAGRNSLLVYLVHQPLLIAVVFMISIIAPPQKADPIQSYLASCESACLAEGSDAGLCTRFCACTLDRLQQQSLLAPLQSGAILPDKDARILELARECSAISQ
ncbi:MULTISPECIES: heparan-alpha-glucosaminide N-acetyltransferase [Alphaproteobacteria]|uniref:Membrane protein n=2 Tax=Alphaproteobacteria TaxID=28211 RepID=A0A512HDA0_9HYPH|nr:MULTISPECIES: DUF1624 domain-containing protein [Alphaproteobacteria]GEO83427.1 membrane protein [Ciceribacter naphthalenivorans]GLR23000.1 membrane protein [Ciceribacter naphthalenivorans]GLT05856.1 membrane protein [Sphingomonas psychrolutea]